MEKSKTSRDQTNLENFPYQSFVTVCSDIQDRHYITIVIVHSCAFIIYCATFKKKKNLKVIFSHTLKLVLHVS